MQNANPSRNDVLMTMARCLSGQWLIDPTWLYNNANLIARADSGADMSHVWPKSEATLMVSRDGIIQSSGKDESLGRGTAMGAISIIGPIYKYGYNSSKNFLSYLDYFAKNDQVGSVKVTFDTPGGQNAGTREVYQAILNFPKPLLVVVDGMLCSAGLYQASGAKKIVSTQPTNMIGCLGTYQTIMDWSGYFASLGIDIYEIYASDSTEKNEGYRQLISSKGKDTKLIEQDLKFLNDHFIADVRNGRGAKLSKDVEKGRVYFTPDAITKGMVDEELSESETWDLLADMQRTTKQQTIQMGLKEQILQLVGADKGDETPAAVEQLTTQLGTVTGERDAAQAQLTGLTTQLNTLTTERDALQTQVSGLNTTVNTLTTERDTLQTRVEELGEQPGAMGTRTTKKGGDIIPDEKVEQTWLQKVAGLEHNKVADDIFE